MLGRINGKGRTSSHISDMPVCRAAATRDDDMPNHTLKGSIPVDIDASARLNVVNWGFYGRETEIEKLRIWLGLGRGVDGKNRQMFRAFAIRGQRGVGKKEVLIETHRRHGDDIPLLMVELPDDGKGKTCVTDILDRIHEQELHSLMHDAPERGPYCRDASWFVKIVRHLLSKGVIICLDEFHNARPAGLESPLKQMIDEQNSNLTQRRPQLPGKLVVMGSHQQHMAQMFGQRDPLFGRVPTIIALRPWSVSTVLDIAKRHGWLSYPERILTLWTMWGGMPESWKRLAINHEYEHLRDFTLLPDDKEWRQEMLAVEQEIILTDESERFDNRAVLELKGWRRSTVLWLGRHSRKRMHVKEFPPALRPERDSAYRPGVDGSLSDFLRKFEMDTDLIRSHDRFTGLTGNRRKDPVWELNDNNSRFQLRVFPDLFRSDRPLLDVDEEESDALTELETLEGDLLERMAAAWLDEHPKVEWSVAHAHAEGVRDFDIDVLAKVGRGEDAYLVVGNAKRNGADHDLADLKEKFKKFLEIGGLGIDQLRDLPCDYMLFSPHFSDRQKASYERLGVQCCSLKAMLAEVESGWQRIRCNISC